MTQDRKHIASIDLIDEKYNGMTLEGFIQALREIKIPDGLEAILDIEEIRPEFMEVRGTGRMEIDIYATIESENEVKEGILEQTPSTQIKVDWKPASELINPSYELYSFFADNLDGKQVAIRLKNGTIDCGTNISSYYVPSDSFEDDKEWCVEQGKMHEPISFMGSSYSYYPSEITHYALLDIAPPEEQQP